MAMVCWIHWLINRTGLVNKLLIAIIRMKLSTILATTQFGRQVDIVVENMLIQTSEKLFAILLILWFYNNKSKNNMLILFNYSMTFCKGSMSIS